MSARGGRRHAEAGVGAANAASAGLLPRLVLRAFSSEFRADHGAELLRDYARLRREAGAPRFWRALAADVTRGAPRERVAAWRARGAARAARAAADPYPPPYRAAVLAALAVWVLYGLTLAPSIGFWDSGEYATVAHSLGIPHPPGNPLFVILAHAWEVLLGLTRLEPAVRINLFSATASAAAHGFWFLVADRLLAPLTRERWLRRAGAACAVALSATAFTVWNQSDVNEKVYTISLFTTAVLVWLALRWRDLGPSASCTGVERTESSRLAELSGSPPMRERVEEARRRKRPESSRRARAGSRGRVGAAGRALQLRRVMPLVLGVSILALTATNHLMGVLAAPALLAFVLLVDGRILLQPRFWAASFVVAALGLSVQLFLPIRAAQRPVISEGDPRCASALGALESVFTWGQAGCPPLSDVLSRKQYGKPPVTVDPTEYPRAIVPRGPVLLAAQLKNFAQYFDWQWARSLAGRDPVFGGARPLVSLLMLILGLLGFAAVARRDRAAALLLGGLFLTLSLGLVAYLNFKYGWALERARFPDPAMHEVRERDYFFILAFSLWGVLAGVGLTRLAQRMGEAANRRLTARRGARGRAVAPWAARVVAAPLLALALAPLPLNWRWASRAQDWTARDWAYNVLMSVGPYGVLVTNGDNDSFPLWYAQNVEGLRTDVTVVLLPYLETPWYVKQLRDLTRPCPAGVDPDRTPTRILCQRPFHPGDIPAALADAGVRKPAHPPKDSILPLDDAEIDRIAASALVARQPLAFRVGALHSTIAAGTTLLPSDTFVAAILRATLGKRPIHFMAPSSAVTKLGLYRYTVRQGLTWKLSDGPVQPGSGTRIVPLPAGARTAGLGAYVDLTRSDTLADDVWLRRGRITDPRAPWTDSANASIPWNYATALLAMAQAHAVVGETAAAANREAQAEQWIRLVEPVE